MAALPSDDKPRPIITPIGLLLILVFILAMVGLALSTQSFVKRMDAPPPGAFLVIAGRENSLFLRLPEKSIKGLHHAVGIRGQLEIPGESVPRPLLARSLNSTEWDTRIKTPQFGPSPTPGSVESHIAVLISTSIPDDPQLYGRIINVTFDLDMIVPRLDPNNPKAGASVPARVSRTVQLQIQPPSFRRIYQRLNFISLAVAGATVLLTLLRQWFRQRRSERLRAAA